MTVTKYKYHTVLVAVPNYVLLLSVVVIVQYMHIFKTYSGGNYILLL